MGQEQAMGKRVVEGEGQGSKKKKNQVWRGSTGSTVPAQSSILLAQLERVTWKILRNFLSFWSQPIEVSGIGSTLDSGLVFLKRTVCVLARLALMALGIVSTPSGALSVWFRGRDHFLLLLPPYSCPTPSSSTSFSSLPPLPPLLLLLPILLLYSLFSLLPSSPKIIFFLHWSCLRLCRLVGGGFQGPAVFPTNVVQIADCACPGSGDDTYIKIDFLTHVTADALKNHT